MLDLTMSLLYKYLLIFFFFGISKAEKIICDGPNEIMLKENEIRFFESPNFPEAIIRDVKENCTINVKGSSEKKNMLLILVITNGYITGGKVNYSSATETFDNWVITQSNIYFFTKNPNLIFSFDDPKIRGHEAFQGFITYEQEKNSNSCVLAGRNKPFEFTDDSEIYYLRSHYYALYDSEHVTQRRCLWEFVAKKGHGFKFETLEINMELANLYPHLFVVTKNTRGYVIGPSITYYPENKIAISYNDQNRSFEARISAYKIPQPTTLFNCLVSDDGIWKAPSDIGYGNKLHCNHTFEIQPNNELHINIDFLFNETGNSLKFYSDENTFFPLNITRNGDFVFLPFTNNTVRRLTFEYRSDESVVNKEFTLKFKSIECKCASSKLVIPCSGDQTFSIMGRGDNVYCTNMKCNFTIAMNETCPDRHIELETNIENPNFDHLLVKSDTDSLINVYYSPFNTESKRNHKVLILPNHPTTMQFESSLYNTTVEWLDVATLTIKAISYERPNLLPDVIISDEKPIFYNEQINKHSIVTIKLSNQLIASKAELEIFFDPTTFGTNCLHFYNNKNLTSIKPINKSIETLGTSVTIYKYNSCLNDFTLFVIRAKKADATDCRFTNTTIITNGRDRISMIAGPSTFCEIVLLNSARGNIIKDIYTNSKTENVLFYNNANKTNELFKYNEKTSKLYKGMTFNARIYLISIPPNSSVFLETEEVEKNIKFSEATFSFYETPKYGALDTKKYHETTFYEIANGFEAIFTVIDYDMSERGNLRITQNDRIKNLTALNESFVANSLNGNNIEIYFAEPEIGYRGAVLNITIIEIDQSSVTTEIAENNTITPTFIFANSTVTATTTTTSSSYFHKTNQILLFVTFYNSLISFK